VKYLTFALPSQPSDLRLGALAGEAVIDLAQARTWAQGARGIPAEPIPESLMELIYAGSATWEYARELVASLRGQDPTRLKSANRLPVGYPLSQVRLYPPLPRPGSLRDFYGFETHVRNAYAIRGRDVPPEWFHFPVFYFTNPNSIYSPDGMVPYPEYTNALDFELEIACVIGKPGIDIASEGAEEYIFGFTIFNDWSARDVQKLEMRVGLGPAKGKDFASSLGPWIVTPDELADRSDSRPGVYDLEMFARVNGDQKSHGNWKDIHYSFGEMIARASEGTYLLPGDVLGSGTVGTGCLLELTRGEGPWLQPGDRVELEIERLGILSNRVAYPQSSHAPQRVAGTKSVVNDE
jgi:fumarylacetoacetate (FAA) hydrolase